MELFGEKFNNFFSSTKVLGLKIFLKNYCIGFIEKDYCKAKSTTLNCKQFFFQFKFFTENSISLIV